MSSTEILSISAAVIMALVFIFFLNKKGGKNNYKNTNPSLVNAVSAFIDGDDNKAIEELKSIVYSKKSAGPEVYLILGFLQRKKGDFTRAAQIHEMITGSADIDKSFKNALYGEIAKDYMLAGQYAKAVELLKQESQILNKPENIITMARCALALQGYDNAVTYHSKYNKLTGKIMPGFFEKCMVEKAVHSDNTSGLKYIKSALESNKFCRPARIVKALLYLKNNKTQKSCSEFISIIDEGILREMDDFKHVEKAFIANGSEAELINILREHSSKGSLNPFIHIALAEFYEYNNDSHSARNVMESYIELPDSKIIAAKEYGKRYNNKLISHALSSVYSYKCRECGYETNNYKDDCPKCSAYDSIYLK